MINENVIAEKTRDFALRIIKLNKHIQSRDKEYILTTQILRSGTSIGANVSESKYAQSLRDFVSKMSIALKESAETEYWLTLLYKSEYITEKEYTSLNDDVKEIIKILSSIIITNKKKIKNF